MTRGHRSPPVLGSQCSLDSLVVHGIRREVRAHSIQMMLAGLWGLHQAAGGIPGVLSLTVCVRGPAPIFQSLYLALPERSQESASDFPGVINHLFTFTWPVFHGPRVFRPACRMYYVTETQKWLLCTPVVRKTRRCNIIFLNWFGERMFIKYILLLVRGWFLNKQTPQWKF